MHYAFAQIHEALQGIYRNMTIPILGAVLRGPVAWWGRMNPIGAMPKDRLGSHVARALQTPGDARDRLTEGIFVPTGDGEHIATLERALLLHHQAEAVVHKIKSAVRDGTLPKGRPVRSISLALEADVITRAEAELLERAEVARADAVAVDHFDLQEYMQTAVVSEDLETQPT